MLYQLSYASALKPSKNSRTGTKIASGRPEISSTSVASVCGKALLRDLQGNTYPACLV
jgi:hypothetical protein